jgi:hypothetical protein
LSLKGVKVFFCVVVVVIVISAGIAESSLDSLLFLSSFFSDADNFDKSGVQWLLGTITLSLLKYGSLVPNHMVANSYNLQDFNLRYLIGGQ